MFPELSTRSLSLCPATDADLDALWALFIDPDVRRFLWDDIAIPRERAAAMLAEVSALADQGLGLWTIRERGADLLLGCAALLPVGAAAEFDARLQGGVEPLVALAPAAWHRGYATEALAAAFDHAFTALNLPELVAVVDVPNEASHRLLGRLGFELVSESDGPKYRLQSYRLPQASWKRRGEPPGAP